MILYLVYIYLLYPTSRCSLRSGSLCLLVDLVMVTPVLPPPPPYYHHHQHHYHHLLLLTCWSMQALQEKPFKKDTVSKQGEHNEIDSWPHAWADPTLGADPIVHHLIPVLTRQDLHKANNRQIRDLGWMRKWGQRKGENSGPESFPSIPCLIILPERKKMSRPWIILNFLLICKRHWKQKENIKRKDSIPQNIESPHPDPNLSFARPVRITQMRWSGHCLTVHGSCQDTVHETAALLEGASWAPVLETWVLV